ncbi:hypothetical protein [Halomonas sp.]|uniref:hypothetical protein n=1 Tax=Halomonas sp. TaxID=1486246 RepID=UPI0025797F40|nr:hypothetical protein [Halomonas sp.]
MDALISLIVVFGVGIGTWIVVVRSMRKMGKGAVARHLAGAVLGFLAFFVATGVMTAVFPDGSSSQEVADSSDSIDAPKAPPEETSDEVNSGPRQFTSAMDMAESWSYNYTPEMNRFEVIGESPLHVRVSAPVFLSANNSREIERDNWQAVATTIYETFIHMDVDEVVVDGIPVQYEDLSKQDDGELLIDRVVSVRVTRDQALSVISGFIDVSSFSDLKRRNDDLGRFVSTQDFSSLISPVGEPGLYDLVAGLIDYCTNDCPRVNSALGASKPDDGAADGHWYEGGSLHAESALAWQDADYENKLATAGDMIATAFSQGMLKDSIASKINGMDDIRSLAEELVNQLDEAFSPEEDPDLNRQLFANQKVNETAVMVLMMMGWVDL